MIEPTREVGERVYRCCCRMQALLDGVPVGWDACPGTVSGPDEPICRDCVAAGHPEAPTFDPAIPSVLTRERSNE